ncbi:MAG: SCO family protein [Planctomycetia bacterium]|nr:SCO family protein [Planctomycetia bacterium]
MTSATRFTLVAIPVALALVVAMPMPAFAGNDGVVPAHDVTKGARPEAGIAEQIGAQVPMDLVFRDENDQPIALRDCIAGKPTILVPVYYRCPMLCTKVLNGLLEALRAMPKDFSAGEQFNVVTVSMDFKEHGELARAKKQVYLAEYGRPGAETGWRFLTGTKEAIAILLGTVGYRFEFDKMMKEYNHPSGLIILSPHGKVTRYFYGIGYSGESEIPEESELWKGKQKPELTESELRERKSGGRQFTRPTTTLRLSLIEAAEGKGGSLLDKLMLMCYRYDQLHQGYSLNVLRAVQLGGIVTLLLVCGGVLIAVKREGLLGVLLPRAFLFVLVFAWISSLAAAAYLRVGLKGMTLITLGFLAVLVVLVTVYRKRSRHTAPPGPPDGPHHAISAGRTV